MMTVRRWDGVLRHSDAQGLAAELAAALAEGDAMVDLSGVTQVDSGVLQVLIAAGALADRTGRRLHLDIPEGSPVWTLAQALALPQLGLPMPAETKTQADAGQVQ